MGFNPADFDALVKAYEKWKATPEGKKRLAETEQFKVLDITKAELPEGWDITDGSVKDGYFEFWHSESNTTVTIELSLDGRPIQFGGQYEYTVTVKEGDAEDEEESEEGEIERTILTLSAEKDWKNSAQQAKNKALEYMRRF